MTDAEIYKQSIECLAEAIMSCAHTSEDLKLLVNMLGLAQKSGSEIQPIIDEVIAANPKIVAEYLAGKPKVKGFLVGQVMKKTGGTANPANVNEIIETTLDKLKSI